MFVEEWSARIVNSIRSRLWNLQCGKVNVEVANCEALTTFKIGTKVMLLENEGVVIRQTYGSSWLMRLFCVHKLGTVTFLIQNGDNVVLLTFDAREVLVLKNARHLFIVHPI